MAFSSVTRFLSTARASAVFTSIFGCITVATSSSGVGNAQMSNGLVSRTSVKPPRSAGATLSAWALPQAKRSPSIAKGINSLVENGLPSK